jgi:signal transduction histidine kinase/CheY-like chemotaxis protein
MIVRLRRALRAQSLPLLLGFVLLSGIVIVRSVLIEQQRMDSLALHEANDFERDLTGLLLLLQDAETGQRGFLLTGEAPYLEPHERAVALLPERLEQLKAAASPNGTRGPRMETIEALVTEKLAELDEVISAWRAGDTDGALDIVRSNRGKTTMDALRGNIMELSREESALFQARLAASERRSDLLRIGSFIALGVVLLLGAFSVVNARRRMRDVSTAQEALIATNAALRREIETREAAETQVRQMQKIEAIGQLTGGIAHDFNNMLAVITSAMNLAQRKLSRGDTDIGKFIEAATDAAARAANLTQRLLAFARQQPLAPQSVNANKMVAGMSDLLRRTLGETIQIETVLAGGLWKTHADPSQLENALINLAVNARDAMPEGGKLTIETANSHLDETYAAQNPGSRAGQYVMLAVTDTGTGMTPEVLAKAFDPFFTTKPVNKGTGLGLSQVFGFVKQSHGHIKIYSEPGEGTTVKIYLPRRVKEEEAVVAIPLARDPDRVVDETVLVVEDDDRVRASTAEAVRELGYKLHVAACGAEALDILERHPEIDLLFTDIVMAEMSGRKLAEEATTRRPDLKVLYTTGFTRNAVVHNGVLDHGVNFLAKPFTIDQLAAKLRDVLDG